MPDDSRIDQSQQRNRDIGEDYRQGKREQLAILGAIQQERECGGFCGSH